MCAAKSSVAIHRNICYPRSAWDTMRESAKKRYKQAACAVYRENSLQAVLWRLALPRKSELPVYIAPYGEPCRREGNFMSDFELLSIVLMFLGILVTVIVAYIQDTKK
ncbi:MAG: hypothetical protein ACLU8J_12150 [Acutalibacter sp.]